MDRRKFLAIAGTSLVVAGGAGYLMSDRYNFERADIKKEKGRLFSFQPEEEAILYLASLAPSGHNTQPWVVKYVEPFHWIIGNDKTKWLPAVDPMQRETILSIGAFLQNLEYAANSFDYSCEFQLLATSNQAEDLVEVTLRKSNNQPEFDVNKIKTRRTVRSGFLSETIKKEHLDFLITGESEYFHFFPNSVKEYQWLNEQTIEANRQQAYRNDAQLELSDWMRFSSKDAQKYCDGLTTASMEIKGIPAWVLRNFYTKEKVMTKQFREQSIDKVKEQVRQSGGWLILTSQDNSMPTLLEAGKRLQRMLLKIREKNIAIHPMTQILEEVPFRNVLNDTVGILSPIQFILRIGYLNNYPDPVSLRRPVERFVKAL